MTKEYVLRKDVEKKFKKLKEKMLGARKYWEDKKASNQGERIYSVGICDGMFLTLAELDEAFKGLKGAENK